MFIKVFSQDGSEPYIEECGTWMAAEGLGKHLIATTAEKVEIYTPNMKILGTYRKNAK